MSYSGAGLYDDDAGADVRHRFRELVADGLTAQAATDTLVEEWGEALDDRDESCAFWLALAHTQWKVGRLEERVRDRALALIVSGEDLARFEHDPRLHRRRAAVLEQLARELATPPRPPTRLRRPFRSVSPVAVGDVFSFALTADRVVYFRCVDMTGDERDSSPTVEILDWDGDRMGDAATARARTSTAPWPDLFALVRYPRDPDPSTQIRVVATGTPVTRRRTLPAQMVAWTDIAEALDRTFEA